MRGSDTEGKPISGEVLENHNAPTSRQIPRTDYTTAMQVMAETHPLELVPDYEAPDERGPMVNEDKPEPPTQRPVTLRSSELPQTVSRRVESPASVVEESGVRSKTADEIIAQHGTDVEAAPPTLRSEDVVAAMRRANGVDDTKAA